MLFRLFRLAILAIFAAASAASTDCVPESIIDSQNYTSVDGVKFTITTSTCKRDIHTRSVASVVYDPLNFGVVKRNPSECTDPNICVCGETCTSTICYDSPAGTVLPSDCTNLASAILSTLDGTFFVDPGQFKIANSDSCEFVFANSEGTELEYCWDEFARTAHSASLRCPAEEGVCFLGSPADPWVGAFFSNT